MEDALFNGTASFNAVSFKDRSIPSSAISGDVVTDVDFAN